MEKVKVALIGYGHLGKWHAQKVNDLETSELVAIVEAYKPNQEAAKATYPNVKVVDTVEEILDQIEAAIVVTPTSTHFEITKNLLKANKHVFCEKPLCSTMQEANQLEQYLGENVLQVGHSERCHQAWEELRNKFKNLNDKKMIRINRFAPFKGRATDVDVVQDLMIHDIDLLLYLFASEPVKVRALGSKIRTDKWDHVTAHFTYANGDEAIIVSGRNHTYEQRTLEVIGSHGCDFVDLFHNKIYFATNEQFSDGSYVQEESYEKRDHLLLEQKYFYDSILKNKPIFVDYVAGKTALKLVEKVLECLELGKEIEI